MEAKVPTPLTASAMLHRGQKPLGKTEGFLLQGMLRGRPHSPLIPWVSVCFDRSAWVLP